MSTIVKSIVELVENEELTSNEIAESLDLDKKYCRSKLTILFNERRISRSIDIPYRYKKAFTPKELLKWLNNHMFENMRTNENYDIRNDLETQNKLLLIDTVVNK